MKISFNPSNSNKNILDLIKNNKDIIFDLKGHSIFARGVEFKGTDTNTWRDIKINNVSIGSHTLDLRNGSNTTLTNTNGVVTINSTWRPVVDNLTSDSTTSSLSAKQGKVLKALIDGKSNSDHNHDGRYLKLTGGTMASNALITFADSGSWDTGKKPQGARGGLYWTGQSDYAKLYAEETVGDNLDLVIQFGDDNSNGLSIRNKANTQTSYISSSGVITTGTFKGNLDWSYITNKPATATRWPSWAEVTGKPSSFTPSTHTHGLSNSVFFLNMPSINGNAKWKEVFGYPVNYNLLLSVRINNPAPEWCVGNFGSGILYGGGDTKGFMSSAYNEPFIMWAGGNGSSDDSVPKWYIGIKGTHKSIYNLATIASEANAAYNLRHSHANKSVLDGITSALVNSWNTAYNFVSNITGTDTDKVINKWEEIVNFLAGITEDNKLNTLLNSKLSIQQLSAKDILTTKTNNALFWVDTKGNASTITTGPFTDHPYALLSVTNYNQNAENYKFFYRSRLAFSNAGDIKVASCHHEHEYQQDETWYNVLTSKNSGINGSTIKLNGTSITVYSSGTADGRYVKKSGDTMQGVLTIDTTNFGALTIKRNDDANGASIQFRGKSSVYGYIGLNNSTKDKQFLRWGSDTSRVYTILDTSSTYISNGKGVINGTTITQVDNATNSTNSTNARKLVNWYSARPTSLNAQFGDGSLRIFYATSSTTEGKPAEDSHILHLAWDNTGGYDAQLAVHTRSGKVSTRAQNGGTWQPWKTLAFTTDIPTSLKNPYSFNVFGVVYDGSAAKTVTTSNFISQVSEGTSTITDGTMLITSYASNSGFADTNAVNVPYKRKAIHLWEYIKAKTDSLYATKVHNHDGIYVRAFRTSNDNIDSDWGQSFKTFDPVPLGTPPEQNPNISLLSIGENFNRRKQLAFIWNNDNIYYRRRIDSGFTNWRRLAFVDQIPTSLKNPHALTISLNGTSQGPYDGSAAKNINITPGSIGAAVSNHSHDYLVVNSADDKSFNSAYHNFQVLYAGGGNGITGKPANVDAFGLFKFRAASGWSGQMLLATGGSLYIRSSEDAKMTNTLAWKTILDSSNYSGILDSRYYTESEVNSLLDAKLNRQNLSYGNWNPRGYHLAADYYYNGGDLSISENNGKMYVSVDGCFWQNEGQYRVLDTSDIGDIRDSVTLHQYLSATDAAWYPLVWGGNAHINTSDSTGAVYKSYDKLSWQISSQTLYATNIQTNNIKNLSIGGGIYWNPNVESASDGSDAASITLVRSGVAGGTTLVLSQMNDTNDTIQFKTNTAARLYHNSYPILTTQNTYVNNNKGYINGTEITQVNNADTLDGYHAASFVKMKQFRFNQYQEGFWTKILTITINSTSDLQPVIAFNWIPSECVRKVWAEFTISWRSNSPIFYAIWKGTDVRTLTCVNSSGNIWNVWVQGDKNSYDPFGEVQVTYAHSISSYNGGSLGYSDSDPGGTRCTLGGYVNYARSTGNADTVDGQHASAFSYKSWWHWYGKDGQPNWLWGGNNENDYYVYNPSNFRVAYASSAGNADTLDGEHASSFVRAGHYESNDLNKLDTYSFIRSVNSNVSSTSPKGNTGWYNVIQLVHRNGASDGPSYIGQIALGMTTNTNDMFFRGKRTDPWKTVIHSGNYTEFINNYYWANVKISTSSSTTTSPTVSNLTATNSIRLGNIHLEHINEINSYDGLFINYRSPADVDLCQGGGNVCIGATLPTQKLDVRGNIITKGLGIQPYYLSKSVLLPTIRLDDGYTYKCLEISATTERSCIIADRAGLMSERGILIKFNKGYDGQIILLKDLQSYGIGNGNFWVMPSGCKIMSADNSSILVGQNQISNTYDDGRSRFLVYSSVYSVWIEFLCSNTF